MKNISRFLPALILGFAALTFLPSMGQQPSTSSMDYLKQQFPKLTKLYEPELKGMKTHYIFAVDISGSMKKYDETVTPALQAFARALPMGEQVTVIPFGTTAKDNTPGLCVDIADEGTKGVLTSTLSTLYTSEAYTPEFKRNTDVNAAVEAINKTLLNNQEAKMNVVVIITDFLNDLPNVGEVKLTEAQLAELSKNFNNSTDDMNVRVVAMKLPPMGSGKGYSLDQLNENVFNQTSDNRRFEIVPVISDQAAISHWFEQLTRDIMTDKLRAVIQLDNKNVTPRINTEIDIDGNTKGDIHWIPSKLYTQVSIDSIYTNPASNYIFKIGKDVIQVTPDSIIQFENLGKLEHKSIGLHKYDEPLNLSLSLPTNYDEELSKLGIEKPVPETAQQKSGWLWTFWLSFWCCVVIIILLVLYLLMVMKAAKRNGSEKFKGNVEITDRRGKVLKEENVSHNKATPIKIGGNGTHNCDVVADWTVNLQKKTYSPFLFWKKPEFEWSARPGVAKSGRKKTGKIGRYGSMPKYVSLECGPDSESVTHYVTIKIK